MNGRSNGASSTADAYTKSDGVVSVKRDIHHSLGDKKQQQQQNSWVCSVAWSGTRQEFVSLTTMHKLTERYRGFEQIISHDSGEQEDQVFLSSSSLCWVEVERATTAAAKMYLRATINYNYSTILKHLFFTWLLLHTSPRLLFIWSEFLIPEYWIQWLSRPIIIWSIYSIYTYMQGRHFVLKRVQMRRCFFLRHTWF